MNNQFPEMKPILGCPGYFITKDGDVYSNRQGKLKRRSNKGQRIILCSEGKTKTFTVSKLLAETWKDEPRLKKQLIHPKHNWIPQDANGNFIKEG